jgi:hypothetical protein
MNDEVLNWNYWEVRKESSQRTAVFENMMKE